MTGNVRFVVAIKCKEGRDADFNEWYSKQHLPDVLSVPGVVAVQRFALDPVQRTSGPYPYGYLTLWEVEPDKVQAVCDEFGRRVGTPLMPITDAIEGQLALMFKPLTERIEA